MGAGEEVQQSADSTVSEQYVYLLVPFGLRRRDAPAALLLLGVSLH